LIVFDNPNLLILAIARPEPKHIAIESKTFRGVDTTHLGVETAASALDIIATTAAWPDCFVPRVSAVGVAGRPGRWPKALRRQACLIWIHCLHGHARWCKKSVFLLKQILRTHSRSQGTRPNSNNEAGHGSTSPGIFECRAS